MKYRYQIVLLVVLIFASCKDEPTDFYELNNQNLKTKIASQYIELKGSNIGPVDKYGLINDLNYFNDELIMLDIKSDSVFVKYNLKNKGLVKSFVIGEGPNEFINAEFVKMTGFTDFSQAFQVYDYNQGIFNLDFENQTKNECFDFTQYNVGSGVQSILQMNDSIYASVSLDPSIKFSIYNAKSTEDKEVLVTEILDFDYSSKDVNYINPKDIGYNKKHEILFTWNGGLNSIDLHSKNGDYLKSYEFGKNENLKERKFERDYFYYHDLKSHGDYIYGVFAGFNITDNFTESIIPNLKSEIHVFNLANNEIKRYKLDRLINACTIDFKNNIAYCVEENSESQPLVKYEMDQEN